ncbi:MAG TPA: ABC transporter permease [Blastocatellia bacterium]|nr:ABC transporter permease [Blastocatellia bacterium]
METFWQDLRYAARVLAKKPGFTIIAVLTLALGIGANTALFSVVDAMLLRKLPVKEPERLVLLGSLAGRTFSPGSYTGNSTRDQVTGLSSMTSFPYQSFTRMREQESVLSDLFAFGNVYVNVNADGQADVATGQAVSGNYYAGLGVEALVGRTITDEDDNAAASPVVVISHRYWQRRFGGNPEVVGRQVNLNNVAFTIIGVTPPAFNGTMQVGSSQDISIPISWEPQINTERSMMQGAGVWWLRIMGRLKPGAKPEQVSASFENAFDQSVLEHRALLQAQSQSALRTLAEEDHPRLVINSGSQGEMNSRQYYAPSLYLLLGVVVLVLIVACANVANLLLARANGRQKEIAVRLALGASRWRLIRQLLTESVLMAAVGGVLGVLFALWIKDGLLSVSDWGGARMSALTPALDLRVLGFTMALSLLTGILFGIAPAWRATRVDLTPALKDSVRSSSTASRSLLSKSLIVAQVAISLLLLFGAGLLLRSLFNLQKVDTGFNQQNLLLFGADPGLIGYKGDRLIGLYNQMAERIEAVPGVRGVTFSRVPLLSGSMSSRSFYLMGVTAAPDGEIKSTGNVYIHQVRENYLETMGIPVLLGRSFTERDNAQAPRVVVVNQTFADRYFPEENPVGKRFSFDSKKPGEVEIIGVTKDAKYSSQREEVPPTAYTCWLQELRSLNSATFEVRMVGDPTAHISAIREAVRDIESNLPLNNIKTQVEQADQTLTLERLFAKLLSLFGLLAQQLASIGLYGVVAYSVSQRTREIGIRMALGARPGDVMKMILRQGMMLVLIGVALGIVSAYVLTKYFASLTSMLYGVNTTDPATFAVIAVLLTAVALVACYIPARRATKVDPMVALRYE